VSAPPSFTDEVLSMLDKDFEKGMAMVKNLSMHEEI